MDEKEDKQPNWAKLREAFSMVDSASYIAEKNLIEERERLGYGENSGTPTYRAMSELIDNGVKYPNGTLVGLPRGMKYDSSKPDLVGVCMLQPELVGYLGQVQDVIDYGAAKYSPDNWKLVANGARRYASAAIRHLVSMIRGQWVDPESGLPHVAHVIVNVLFVAWLIQHGTKNEPNK